MYGGAGTICLPIWRDLESWKSPLATHHTEELVLMTDTLEEREGLETEVSRDSTCRKCMGPWLRVFYPLMSSTFRFR